MIELNAKEFELLRTYFESKNAFQRKKALKKINEHNESEMLENECLRYGLGGK